VIFLHKGEVISWHARVIAQHGGSPEMRDEVALDSALIAAQNRFHYEATDVIGCAAAYAFHLTNAHALLDGNKRVAAVATEVFLEIDGVVLTATEKQLFILYMGIADGSLNRDAFEKQLRSLAKELKNAG